MIGFCQPVRVLDPQVEQTFQIDERDPAVLLAACLSTGLGRKPSGGDVDPDLSRGAACLQGHPLHDGELRTRSPILASTSRPGTPSGCSTRTAKTARSSSPWRRVLMPTVMCARYGFGGMRLLAIRYIRQPSYALYASDRGLCTTSSLSNVNITAALRVRAGRSASVSGHEFPP